MVEVMPAITAAGGMGIALVTNVTFALTPPTMAIVSRAATRRVRVRRRPAYALKVTKHPGWLDFWQRLFKPSPTWVVQSGRYAG